MFNVDNSTLDYVNVKQNVSPNVVPQCYIINYTVLVDYYIGLQLALDNIKQQHSKQHTIGNRIEQLVSNVKQIQFRIHSMARPRVPQYFNGS